MSEQLFKSNAELKRMEKQAEQAAFLEQKRKQEILDRWEEAQVKAATAQSVLDYMVQQYEEHKAELEAEIVEQTEEQIALRKKEIEEFIMSEKEVYLESIGIQAD
jgi:hypothetical protein